jgi:hypothetical protein
VPTLAIVFWGVRAIVLAAALAVALAVPVVPVLETLLGSEGWARAAEVLLLLFFIRVVLVLLAIREGRVGFLGIELEDASRGRHEASLRAVEDRLLLRIGAIGEAFGDLVRRVRALERRVDVLEETRFDGG